MVLTAPNEPGAQVYQSEWTKSPNQIWIRTMYLGGLFMTYQNYQTGLFLGVERGDNHYRQGAAIVTNPESAGDLSQSFTQLLIPF